MLTRDGSLILVPTARERDVLARSAAQHAATFSAELCGFGPVSAAAATAALIAEQRPRRVLLVGIAGAFPGTPLGQAFCFASVRQSDIGLPAPPPAKQLISGAQADMDPWARTQFDDLSPWPQTTCLPCLLTVGIPSADADVAAQRFAAQEQPAAEDMEGYGVALACRRANLPLTILRGTSNQVGDRDYRRWQIDAALAAVFQHLLPHLAFPSH